LKIEKEAKVRSGYKATGTSVQISFRSVCGTQDWRESEIFQDTGGVEVRRIALLSQQGSTIEPAGEIVRGVVPELHFLGMHSKTFRLRNHPSHHREERDDAALLTQEGNSLGSTGTIILCVESIWDSSASAVPLNSAQR
jgi:hypothetical protein